MTDTGRITEGERQERVATWWGTARVAAHCGGVRPAHVRGWVDDGLLTAWDARRKDAERPCLRFRPDEVMAFWETRRVGGDREAA